MMIRLYCKDSLFLFSSNPTLLPQPDRFNDTFIVLNSYRGVLGTFRGRRPFPGYRVWWGINGAAGWKDL